MNKPLLIFKGLLIVMAIVITLPASGHHEEVPVAALPEASFDEQKGLESTIAQIERVEGNFAFNLYEPLMALGNLYQATGRYYLAAETFRRTQHLTHRQLGVYTHAQMPSIDKLIKALAGAGDYHGIDTQQHFRFRVASRAFNPEDNRLVAAKVKLADWYRSTSRFEDALALYEEVDTANLATGDKVRVLRSQALTMYLADRCCAAEKLHQAYELAVQSDAVGPVEKLDAYSDYLDMAAIESKAPAATMTARAPKYLGFADAGDVLNMMALRKMHTFKERAEVYVDFGEPEKNAPLVKIMGYPVAMCSNTFGKLVSRDTNDSQLHISMTVTDSGSPRDIEIRGEMPARLKRYVRQSLQLGRFQSATNDLGEPVSAPLAFTQNFAVHQQAVTSRNQVPQWSNMLVSQTCQTKGVQRI